MNQVRTDQSQLRFQQIISFSLCQKGFSCGVITKVILKTGKSGTSERADGLYLDSWVSEVPGELQVKWPQTTHPVQWHMKPEASLCDTAVTWETCSSGTWTRPNLKNKAMAVN